MEIIKRRVADGDEGRKARAERHRQWETRGGGGTSEGGEERREGSCRVKSMARGSHVHPVQSPSTKLALEISPGPLLL